MRALVADAHPRGTVHGIRALGRAGIETIAVAASWKAPGLWSRHAFARHLAPPSREPERFAAAVAGIARRHEPVVVFPGREAALDALADPDMSMPEGSRLASPGLEVLESLRDKVALADLADGAGLRTPRTFAAGSARHVREAGCDLPLPCVVKSARPGPKAPGARVMTSRPALVSLLDELGGDERLLVQEYLRGPLTALSVVLDRRGVVVARFQQAALRTFPPDVGVSALAVSVAPDAVLSERVGAMLSSAGFWGMAQLQFLAAGRDPVLIDVNPRFYGSMSLALAAGVNLPACWHAVACDAPAGPPRPYRLGVRYRWLEADLAMARRGEGALLRPARRPVAGAWWASDDPLPALMLAGEAFRARVPSRLRRSSR